jgi:hypothetical protein
MPQSRHYWYKRGADCRYHLQLKDSAAPLRCAAEPLESVTSGGPSINYGNDGINLGTGFGNS